MRIYNVLLICVMFLLILIIISSCSVQNQATQTVKPSSIITTTPVSTQVPQIETTKDLAVPLPSNQYQLKNASFSPLFPRNEAIAVAKNWLYTTYKLTADNSILVTTVALFSGPVGIPTDPPSKNPVSDVQVWVVLIKGLPNIGSGGPPPKYPTKWFTTGLFYAVIDSNTGDLICPIYSGRLYRIPATLTAFPVQLLPLPQSDSASLIKGTLFLDNGYLRLNNRDNYLLFWPFNYIVQQDNNIITIHKEQNIPVAQLGDKIQVSGSKVLPSDNLQILLTFDLPKDAPGPYWLVGSITGE
jgi:hypothetical protein